MNFVMASKTKINRPRWILANLVETKQAAADNVVKGYDRIKNKQKELEKKTVLTPGVRNEHSYMSKREKLQKDVFGATILPSNLSFENMKKLSMNQIKLEEIPLVCENNEAETIMAEKMRNIKEVEKVKKSIQENMDSVPVHTLKSSKIMSYVDFSKADPFETIPGPQIMKKTAATIKCVTQQLTLAFLFQLLRSGSLRPFQKYGPLIKMPEILGAKTLLVSRIEYIISILEQDTRHPKSSCLDILEASRLRRHGKERPSNLWTDFDWSETRRPIDDIFLRDEERYFDALYENGYFFIKRIRAAKNRGNSIPDDFINEINKWSLECLLRIIFQKKFGFLDPKNLMSNNLKLLGSLRAATFSFRLCERGLHMWKFMNTSATSTLDVACWTIEEILSHHLYQSQVNVTSEYEDRKSRSLTLAEGMLLLDGITKADVLTQLLDTLLIGMNAVSTAFVFLLYHLARNPGEQIEVFRETKKILPQKYNRPEYEQLRSFKYLHACLKESLRLKMPTPVFSKILTRDVTVSNFQVPRGTLVLLAAQVDALREENFENAQEFRPRRWLDLRNKHPFIGLSLNTYDRNTFESRLAEVAVILCAAQIVRNFIIEYRDGSLNATTSAISHPNSPLKFHFVERKE